MSYRYDASVLKILAAHGLCPTPDTPPSRCREALNDLYRYEIRRLRDRLKRGEVPRADYVSHVVRLRERYGLLSLPLSAWADGGERQPGASVPGI
jgi:hypothetical protein